MGKSVLGSIIESFEILVVNSFQRLNFTLLYCLVNTVWSKNAYIFF